MSEQAPQKGIRFDIYRWASKNVIYDLFPGSQRPTPDPSDAVTAVTVVGEGICQHMPVSDDAPAFRLVKRVIFGDQVHWHIEPVSDEPRHFTPGGNWAMASGRSQRDFPPGFPKDHPIQVFDRIEGPLK